MEQKENDDEKTVNGEEAQKPKIKSILEKLMKALAIDLAEQKKKAEDTAKMLKSAGAKMGGLTFTLKWRAPVDLDLGLTCAHRFVNFSNKNCSSCGTSLDIDMQSDAVNKKWSNGFIG